MKHPLRIIYTGAFLFSLGSALLAYVNSGFVASFVGESKVGLVYAASSVINLVFLILAPKIDSIFGNRNLISFFSLVASFCLLGLVKASDATIAIPLFILYLSSMTIVMFSLDIFVEAFSKDEDTGHNRGFFLTTINIAWIMSPLLSGYLITLGGYTAIIPLTALALMSVSFIFSHFMRAFKDPAYQEIDPRETLKKVKEDRNLSLTLVLQFLLQFFFSIMVIYTPIYLHTHIGLSWQTIGAVFTVMLLPFGLFQIPLGIVADKWLGEKEIMFFGFIIMAIAVFFVPNITMAVFAPWAIILFLSRTGAASVEVMTETYYFKKINSGDAGLISALRSMVPLAYITGPLVASLVIEFYEIKSIFYILGFMMLLGALITLLIKDTK